MAKRSVLIVDRDQSALADMLEEFFEDTESLPDKCSDTQEVRSLISKNQYTHFFIHPELMTQALAQALKVQRQTLPDVSVFALAPKESCPNGFDYDFVLSGADSMSQFQKNVLSHLAFPDKLKVLVVDDEPEIGSMIQDFLERRVDPAFEVKHARDGQAGIDLYESFKPDILILDIKMPIKDGREVFREIQTKHGGVPTIVFFDAVAGHEISEMRDHGNPVIIEKGAPQSSLPELMQLIKKMYFFS